MLERTSTVSMGGYNALSEPDCSKAIHMTVTVCLLIGIAFIGVGVIVFALGLEPIEWKVMLIGFGLCMSSATALMAHTMFSNVRYSWSAYYDQQAEWHEAVMATYKRSAGMDITESISIYDLDPRRYGDMLAILKYVYEHKDTANMFTRRALEQPIYLSGSTSNQTLIGALKGVNPERTGVMLQKLGIVKNRSIRQSGELCVDTYDVALQLLDKNWHKVANSPS